MNMGRFIEIRFLTYSPYLKAGDSPNIAVLDFWFSDSTSIKHLATFNPEVVSPQTFTPFQKSVLVCPTIQFKPSILVSLVLGAWIFYLYKHYRTEPAISSFQGASIV
jgi:hypothetical protein